jgi:hypothetical protein
MHKGTTRYGLTAAGAEAMAWAEKRPEYQVVAWTAGGLLAYAGVQRMEAPSQAEAEADVARWMDWRRGYVKKRTTPKSCREAFAYLCERDPIATVALYPVDEPGKVRHFAIPATIAEGFRRAI